MLTEVFVLCLCAGAAMFVQCVVASEVIRISKGAPCRGATLRDVATYTLSLLGVALSFASGTVSPLLPFDFNANPADCFPPSSLLPLSHFLSQITRWFVVGAILVYALYAIWVFCGDEWHARGRPSLSWPELQDLLLQRWAHEEGQGLTAPKTPTGRMHQSCLLSHIRLV